MSLLPRSRRRALLGTLTATATAGVLVLGMSASPALSAVPAATGLGAPHATHTTAKKPRQASVTSVKVRRLPASQRATTRLRPGARAPFARLAATGTRDYGLVGVTWAHGTGSGVRIKVRTKTAGTWSAWQKLDVDEDGESGAGTREGTEPLWVGSADGVAARVSTTGKNPPQDLRIDLVDPGDGPASAKPTASTARSVVDPIVAAGGTSLGGGAARSVGTTAVVADRAAKKKKTKKPSRTGPDFTPRPAIFTRAAWGARAAKPCDSPIVSPTMLGVVFHHTAGSNSYTPDQSAAIVRAIQAYHQNGRGWCDIGYNFLVDKYGQIFEGRDGGVNNTQIRAAHAGNTDVNIYAMGVSMMGNLDTAKMTGAMKAATVQLIGWRLGTSYVPARGRYALDGHLLKRISGHRDVYKAGFRPATRTACPGKWGYKYLTRKNGLRTQVANYIADYTSPIKSKWLALGGPAAGLVTVGESPLGGGMVTQLTTGDIFSAPGLGAHLVNGPVLSAYVARGGALGSLGFPVSDLQQGGIGTQSVQQFQGGTITYDSATGITTTTP